MESRAQSGLLRVVAQGQPAIDDQSLHIAICVTLCIARPGDDPAEAEPKRRNHCAEAALALHKVLCVQHGAEVTIGTGSVVERTIHCTHRGLLVAFRLVVAEAAVSSYLTAGHVASKATVLSCKHQARN